MRNSGQFPVTISFNYNLYVESRCEYEESGNFCYKTIDIKNTIYIKKYIILTEKMSKIYSRKYEIYQRGRQFRVADTELVLLIAHFILAPGSIPGIERVRRDQT